MIIIYVSDYKHSYIKVHFSGHATLGLGAFIL